MNTQENAVLEALAEVFLKEASVIIEQWRKEYNQVRPHSSLGYKQPAPEVKILTLKPDQKLGA